MQTVGRLAWRCRRGMKELDLVLTRYLRERWPAAEDRERAAFEQILDLPDPQLAAYLMGRERTTDQDVQGLLDALRAGTTGPVAGSAGGTPPGGECA